MKGAKVQKSKIQRAKRQVSNKISPNLEKITPTVVKTIRWHIGPKLPVVKKLEPASPFIERVPNAETLFMEEDELDDMILDKLGEISNTFHLSSGAMQVLRDACRQHTNIHVHKEAANVTHTTLLTPPSFDVQTPLDGEIEEDTTSRGNNNLSDSLTQPNSPSLYTDETLLTSMPDLMDIELLFAHYNLEDPLY